MTPLPCLACSVPSNVGFGHTTSCFQADAVTLWVFDKGGCYRSSPNTKPRILAPGSLVGPRLAVFGFGLVVVTRSHSRPVGELSTCGRGEGFLRLVIKGDFALGSSRGVFGSCPHKDRRGREPTPCLSEAERRSWGRELNVERWAAHEAPLQSASPSRSLIPYSLETSLARGCNT